MGQVNLYKWECRGDSFTWHLFRTYHISDKEINNQIIKALEEGHYYFMYRWECFNELGELEGFIYNNMYNTFTYDLTKF